MYKQYKQAVGYVRVSTQMQKEEGFSLEAQRAAILRYCTSNNLDFIKFYADEGLSGKNIEMRPSLKLLLEELKPKTLVIVISLSRLARNIDDARSIMKNIQAKGGYLKFLDIDVDTSTPMGEMCFSMMGAIAQFERDNTTDRISSTMNNMSREGTLIKKPRFGYRIERDGKNTNIVEDPQEQMVITKIRELIEEDKKITVTQICKILIADQITLRRSKKIYPSYIRKIITDNHLRSY